jgi:hypothetical protein
MQTQTDEVYNKGWWLVPLFFTAGLIALAITVCRVSETAQEVLTKAVFNILGAVSTPFILEVSVAIVGLCVVVAYNQWRLHKEGDGWVYLAQTEPDPASLAEGAETPPHRLDPVVLPQKPDTNTDLNARLAIVEGFLELGLKKEALEHLNLLGTDERNLARVQSLYLAVDPSKSA